jgi:hypothetical protein
MTRRRSNDKQPSPTRARDNKDFSDRMQRKRGSDGRTGAQGIENDERGQLQPGDQERARKNR